MNDLPATDMRRNVLTLAISPCELPAVAYRMTQLLPAEQYDRTFKGQHLETTYFDTAAFDLRAARLKKKYLTLRIRCYRARQSGTAYRPEDSYTYALSAKTQDQKYRRELPSADAEYYLTNGIQPDELGKVLPGDLLARAIDLLDGEPLLPIVRIDFTRYAVESETDRLTLDTEIKTNTGKVFPTNILEAKTTDGGAKSLPEIEALPYPRVKLSKFLWATAYGAR
jgi:hypothetical protein